MSATNLLVRAKAILLTPTTEWPAVASEATTTQGLYLGYVAPLSAIPPVAGFLSLSVFGLGMPGLGAVRIGVGAGLVNLVISYVVGLIGVFLMALLVDFLAPRFGGQSDRMQALKAVAYSCTAAWVASVGQLLPWIGGFIALAGAIYSVYLLYLGLPLTMKCPKEKSAAYTAVAVVAAILIGVVLSSLLEVID